MGREIKRVTLGFDWPLEKKWEGYVNPFYVPCPSPDCDGGQTWGGWWLQSMCYLLGMLAEWSADERGQHPWFGEIPLAPTRLRSEYEANYPNGSGKIPPPYAYEVKRPTSDFAKLVEGLIGKSDGYGSGREYKLYKAITKAAKVKDFGVCDLCGGDGIDPAYQERYEAWQPTEPPNGEGWQVWETVSEGSPITPVFATSDELVDYLATKGTTWDQKSIGSSPAKGPWRREAAEAFVRSGSAPSMVSIVSDGKVEVFMGGRDDDRLEARRSSAQ